jgi:hypothetical protein
MILGIDKEYYANYIMIILVNELVYETNQREATYTSSMIKFNEFY